VNWVILLLFEVLAMELDLLFAIFSSITPSSHTIELVRHTESFPVFQRSVRAFVLRRPATRLELDFYVFSIAWTVAVLFELNILTLAVR
jgi:hypothetical protein